jgi:ketopantoate reductase
MTRIAVYGAGGVGGYFGARLAQAGAEVHVLARGAHLQALREHGLKVRSVKGDFQVQVQATDDPADIGPCDFVLFCVKTFDTDAAAARLGPLLRDGTAVVSLQNGVENEEKLAQVVGEDHVMGGAAFIFAGIAERGVIDRLRRSQALVCCSCHSRPLRRMRPEQHSLWRRITLDGIVWFSVRVTDGHPHRMHEIPFAFHAGRPRGILNVRIWRSQRC